MTGVSKHLLLLTAVLAPVIAQRALSLAPTCPAGTVPSVPTSFAYTGSVASFAVPPSAAALVVQLWGAGGGGSYNATPGGGGAYVTGLLPAASLVGAGALLVAVGGGGLFPAAGGASSANAVGLGGARRGILSPNNDWCAAEGAGPSAVAIYPSFAGCCCLAGSVNVPGQGLVPVYGRCLVNASCWLQPSLPYPCDSQSSFSAYLASASPPLAAFPLVAVAGAGGGAGEQGYGGAAAFAGAGRAATQLETPTTASLAATTREGAAAIAVVLAAAWAPATTRTARAGQAARKRPALGRFRSWGPRSCPPLRV